MPNELNELHIKPTQMPYSVIMTLRMPAIDRT